MGGKYLCMGRYMHVLVHDRHMEALFVGVRRLVGGVIQGEDYMCELHHRGQVMGAAGTPGQDGTLYVGASLGVEQTSSKSKGFFSIAGKFWRQKRSGVERGPPQTRNTVNRLHINHLHTTHVEEIFNNHRRWLDEGPGDGLLETGLWWCINVTPGR